MLPFLRMLLIYHGSAITNNIVYLNRILQFELMLSISGLVVALGALLTGVFGKKWLGYCYSLLLGTSSLSVCCYYRKCRHESYEPTRITPIHVLDSHKRDIRRVRQLFFRPSCILLRVSSSSNSNSTYLTGCW